MKDFSNLLERSVQVNDGLTQTSADGACLAFDKEYGIMFCGCMPGRQGCYGESRGKIALSCFPASQPTNIRFVTIAEGRDVYVPNILSLGGGRVRIFYEMDSRAEGDHDFNYKDYDFFTGELSEEKTVMVKKEDGSLVPLCLSVQFEYLEARGFTAHRRVNTEQMGHCAFFREGEYVYGAAPSYFAEGLLFRSQDDCATVEFFAVCPETAQYEFEYRFLNGNIYAIFRTDRDADSIGFTVSEDMGKTWSKPTFYADSIQCRPRVLVHNGQILTAYNYFSNEKGNRPDIRGGRGGIRLCLGENADVAKNVTVADLHSKYGIVNVSLTDILGDVYMAYSTSELALDIHNGMKSVRGKDAVRYVKLGDLTV